MVGTRVERNLGHVDLVISGMTSASCAPRVEKCLNKLDGVTATVNFASEQAAISFDPAQVPIADLVAAVEAIGYEASLPENGPEPDDPARPYRARLLVAAVLSIPEVVFAWAGATRFSGWQWVALVLATVVVGYAGCTVPQGGRAQWPPRRGRLWTRSYRSGHLLPGVGR